MDRNVPTAPLPSFLEEVRFYSPPPPDVQPVSPPELPSTPYSSACYSPVTCVSPPQYSHLWEHNSTPQYFDLEDRSLSVPRCSTIDTDELNLVTATLAAEATGTSTPIIKDELRYKIQKKRRDSGKEPLAIEFKEEGPEQLTKVDLIRRHRRKESNRRAAAKCRVKKKAAEEVKQEERVALERENDHLHEQVKQLELQTAALQKELSDHILICPLGVVKEDYSWIKAMEN